MNREVPPAVMKMMNKYGAEFKEIFDTELSRFVGKLWIVGISDFDIIKFEEYMRTRRSYEDKDSTLADYVEKRYGKRGRELIDELLGMDV